jgi:hypothetical protein
VKWSRFFLIAIVVALGAWAWVALHPSPERLIRRRLESVAHAASFGPGQGFLSKVAGAQSLANSCATNIEVKIDVPGHQEHSLASREDIQQAALAMRASIRALTVTFPDIIVNVSADQQSAVADLTLEARVAGESDMIVQEVKVTLQKIDGKWLMTKVETVRTLK